MYKSITLAAALILALTVISTAQDCIFQIGDDDSLEQALTSFHDLMAEMLHGPVEEGDLTPIRDRIVELTAARDAVLAANLPSKYSDNCADISVAAKAFSDSINSLTELVELQAEDDEIKQAFMKVHDTYQGLREAMIQPEEMIEALHEIIHPLWHDSYPAKDTDAIKEGTPKLKIRAKLLLSIAERIENPEMVKATKDLLEAITTLEEAITADDDLAILEAFKLVHDAYHGLTGSEE
jgi:hypothetical protein